MTFTEAIIPLLTLISLEVILGIDNIIFIAILSDKLPEDQRDKLRIWGIALAMIMRLALLTVIAWILKLEATLFTIRHIKISGKDLILILGGLFLLYKSTIEIYRKTETTSSALGNSDKPATFKNLLLQVILLDIVFSIDSIVTAVGMVSELWVMYTAVIVTVLIMLVASKPISQFINRHPSFKILALCFLLIIGIALIAEGFDFKIPKGYIYFAMGFSFMVDVIQMKVIKPKI